MLIYKITNTVTGYLYIGQTTRSIEKRWAQHVDNSKKLDYYLYRSIRLYGLDNFIIEKIDFANSIEELNFLEERYIKELNTLAPNGYNLNSGGKSKKLHQETKDKISKANKGKKRSKECIANFTLAMIGRIHSQEHKDKISKANKGKPKSEEHKNNISKGHLGIRPTEETRLKMSRNRKGKFNLKKRKKVQCIENGQIFQSVNELSSYLGINQSSASQCVRNGYKNRKTGLSFRFI